MCFKSLFDYISKYSSFSHSKDKFLLLSADETAGNPSKDLILTKLEIPQIVLDTPNQIGLPTLAVHLQMLNSPKFAVKAHRQLSEGETDLHSTDGNNQRM